MPRVPADTLMCCLVQTPTSPSVLYYIDLGPGNCWDIYRTNRSDHTTRPPPYVYSYTCILSAPTSWYRHINKTIALFRPLRYLSQAQMKCLSTPTSKSFCSDHYVTSLRLKCITASKIGSIYGSWCGKRN